MAAANRRTIVVLNSGAPVVAPWLDDVSAVLSAWFPGQEFGDALADVLSGDVEPGGRLPMTWPAAEGDVPIGRPIPVDGRLDYREGVNIGYRAWLRDGRTPAFTFGHGLGYTDWRLSALRAAAIGAQGDVRVWVDARNVGRRSGKCVVQFYLERQSESSVERPTRWLAGFQPVYVDAGESTEIEVDLSWRRFAHWEQGDWHLEPGQFRLIAGLSSGDTRLATTVDITAGEPSADLAAVPGISSDR